MRVWRVLPSALAASPWRRLEGTPLYHRHRKDDVLKPGGDIVSLPGVTLLTAPLYDVVACPEHLAPFMCVFWNTKHTLAAPSQRIIPARIMVNRTQRGFVSGSRAHNMDAQSSSGKELDPVPVFRSRARR
ncbi:hypothetical protein NDU88_006308 [Pleurodeles waltl]|uniref:Secreted protein n=1 Tax=Pleurodeles waltl TaxID=8319 RepID=A0AAV7SPD9_PLEWA|nr:hypothetical protein NDU88_006308 [Pleurodeles waltl]